jgi:hypothetical protein
LAHRRYDRKRRPAGAASEAPIIAFNVRANKQARDAAEAEGIEIRYYNIIYDLVDDIKAAMEGLLSPERRETLLGNAEILEVFNITKVGKVAGCMVTEGKVERGAGVRLIRDNVVIHEGKLKTLKRFKDEVPEVRRPGMRHGVRELRRHPPGRCDRMLPRGPGVSSAPLTISKAMLPPDPTRVRTRPPSTRFCLSTPV